MSQSPPFEAFEEVEHTADWSLRVRGRTLAELFHNAAAGMNSLLLPPQANIDSTVSRTLTLEAIDAESLLVDWLSELAYYAETEQLIFDDITLSDVTDTRLQATVRGGPVAALQKHIKAVTYHNLVIITTPQGRLETTIVFDV